MLSPGSAEDTLSKKLEELGCARNNFAEISGVVSKARFTQGLFTRRARWWSVSLRKMILRLKTPHLPEYYRAECFKRSPDKTAVFDQEIAVRAAR
jgi:hypothetical protein